MIAGVHSIRVGMFFALKAKPNLPSAVALPAQAEKQVRGDTRFRQEYAANTSGGQNTATSIQYEVSRSCGTRNI